MQNFLDLSPSGGAGRPSTLPSTGRGNLGGAVAGGVAGGAAAEFLRDSATRPSTLPAGGERPGIGERPGVGERPDAKERPAVGERPDAKERPAVKERPGIGEGPGTKERPGAKERPGLKERPGTGERPGIGERPGVGDRPLAGNRPERIENRQQWRDRRVERRDEIRDQVSRRPIRDFWRQYPGWAAWRITRPFRWATWAALTDWVSFGWSQPSYYYYGENVFYQDGSVYYGDQPVATAEEYAQQAEAIAASAPETDAEEAEWLPLGVFALTQDGESTGPDPTLFLQLAISREGILAGTLYNSATETTQAIEGMADKASQRCAWTIAGESRPIMETGINNLTQDTAPALVHFADGQTQQWLMVRLEEPVAEQ